MRIRLFGWILAAPNPRTTGILEMTTSSLTTLLDDMVRDACKAGADAADAMLVDEASVSVTYRLGKVETLERAESGDLGLRVFVGKRQAVVSATDRSRDALKELVDRAVAMAKLVPEDEFCGLADAQSITKQWPQLDMADDTQPDIDKMIAQAREAENAALAVKGVTNSEGGSSDASSAEVTFVASNGFVGHYRRTSYSLSAVALAGDNTQMERDHDFASCVVAADIPSPSIIGKKAGERTVRRLGSRENADRANTGGIRTTHRGWSCWPTGKRDFGSRHRAWHQLPERQAWAGDFYAPYHDHRRSVPCARLALPAFRCRRAFAEEMEHHRQGCVDDMAARYAFGAAIKAEKHRPCLAFAQRPARTFRQQSVYATGIA